MKNKCLHFLYLLICKQSLCIFLSDITKFALRRFDILRSFSFNYTVCHSTWGTNLIGVKDYYKRKMYEKQHLLYTYLVKKGNVSLRSEARYSLIIKTNKAIFNKITAHLFCLAWNVTISGVLLEVVQKLSGE